ncbi:alpha-1,2-fucosyltransferase [Sulfitobacter sp. 916]|uniref:alpha-1,2-fucosyltransferase n=1 Tax=Sulfitobacter sp. 916 TaxID=3368559 RepID=UPI0037462906
MENRTKPTHFVVTRIKGGLGNQLFCYAAARSLSERLGATLVIDHVSGFGAHDKYNREYELDKFSIASDFASASQRLEPLAKYRRSALQRLEKRRAFVERRYIYQEQRGYDSRFHDIKGGKNLYLDGYWQSEKYFSDIEKIIRDDLTMPRPMSLSDRLLEAEIGKQDSVAVHMRFFEGDYTEDHSNVCPAYYRDAVQIMESKLNNPRYFIFSDNPELADHIEAIPADRKHLVTHNTDAGTGHADMWLMSLCNNFIIANSTFSWWGAWLSGSPNKTVIAPASARLRNSSSWDFPGLIPDSWILC